MKLGNLALVGLTLESLELTRLEMILKRKWIKCGHCAVNNHSMMVQEQKETIQIQFVQFALAQSTSQGILICNLSRHLDLISLLENERTWLVTF